MAWAARSGHIRAGCAPEPATYRPRRWVAGLRWPTSHTDPRDSALSASRHPLPMVSAYPADVGCGAPLDGAVSGRDGPRVVSMDGQGGVGGFTAGSGGCGGADREVRAGDRAADSV